MGAHGRRAATWTGTTIQHAQTPDDRSRHPEVPADPARRRDALADHIAGVGWFTTAPVEAAFRKVPWHLFLPGTELADAYA
jgi:hypothetical protein